MKLQTIKFKYGQAVAVDTYVGIMANACEVVTSHLSRPNLSNNYFFDFKTLANDKTVDKMELANDIQDEITAKNGDYLRADFKDLGFTLDKFVWFEMVHQQAIKAAMQMLSFDSVDLTIVK